MVGAAIGFVELGAAVACDGSNVGTCAGGAFAIEAYPVAVLAGGSRGGSSGFCQLDL